MRYPSPPPSPYPWTTKSPYEVDLDKVIAGLRAGRALTEIGRELGVSHPVLSRRLAEAGYRKGWLGPDGRAL